MNRVVFLIALACCVLSAWICWSVLGAIPHISDELSYLYQGRILSTARLSVEAPAVPEAFTVRWDHILRDGGRWRTIYPPGWPFLLAMGWWLHATWLINPLLLGLTVIGVFRLATQLFEERTGLFAVIAFATSTFVLLMSAGFMSHTPALCFATWCAFFLVRSNQKDILLAGIFGALTFAVRPYTAAFLLLPFVLWSVWSSLDRKRMLLRLTIGAFPVLLLFLIYNSLLFGSMLRTGYSFDPDAQFRGSLFGNFLENAPWYFSELNRSLWNWPWPDLLIFTPLLLPHQKWRSDVILFLCFLSLLCGYSVYYYKDIVYSGPRYIFESAGFLAILAARSLRILEEKLPLQRRWSVLVLLLFLYSPLVTLPHQMDYHRQAYHGQSKELLDLVESKGIAKNALILIGGDPYVFRTFALENSLNPAGSARVFVRDVPELRDKILAAYPRAEVWKMGIELTPLKGVNSYEDRFLIRTVKFEKK